MFGPIENVKLLLVEKQNIEEEQFCVQVFCFLSSFVWGHGFFLHRMDFHSFYGERYDHTLPLKEFEPSV